MENTVKTGKTEISTDDKVLLNQVNSLMKDVAVDVSFAARWTEYDPSYLSKFLRGLRELNDNVREALKVFRDKLMRMKEIMLAEAA